MDVTFTTKFDVDPQIQDGWAVLLDDIAVHEARAVAEALECAQIRCRLEILQEDREFHLYGNIGMGTRMRVLVAPRDYDTAKRISKFDDEPLGVIQ